jgi:hypothetical protein
VQGAIFSLHPGRPGLVGHGQLDIGRRLELHEGNGLSIRGLDALGALYVRNPGGSFWMYWLDQKQGLVNNYNAGQVIPETALYNVINASIR